MAVQYRHPNATTMGKPCNLHDVNGMKTGGN